MRAMSISVLVKKGFVGTGRQMYNNLKKTNIPGGFIKIRFGKRK